MNKLMMMLYGLMDEEPTGTGEEPGAGGGALSDAGDAAPGGDGALSDAGDARPAAETAEPDWANMTDEDYFKGFQAPEGVEVDLKDISANYGKFLRENRIPQKALAEYLKIDAGIRKAADEKAAAEREAEDKALKEQMADERAALVKEFNPEQIKVAVEALRGFKEDRAFFEAATGRYSNNSTLVRLLVNWAETHGGDGLPGVKPTGGGGDDFVRNWTGASGGAR